MRKLLSAAVAVGCLALPAAGVVTGVFATASSAATSGGPCGTMAVSSTSYTHVLWVWMENHGYSTIIGSPQARYINTLAVRCGVATNYHNITHPSLPNYIASTSGLAPSALAPFTSDCDPSRTCATSTRSLFSEGESWKAYEDSMPGTCSTANAGNYAVRHNPPPYYTTLKGCRTNDVPYTALASDLAGRGLPAFSFVTPDVSHDMHNGTVVDGDRWLSTHLPAILASRLYRAGRLVVFVTWDEGEGGTSSSCATNTTDPGCHVTTLVVSPSTTRHTRSATLFNHYSLLRTTEQLLGVPYLGQAASARSMKSAFNL